MTDPGEIKDLADSNPEKLAEMCAHWAQYEAETGTVLKPLEEIQKAGYKKVSGIDFEDWPKPF